MLAVVALNFVFSARADYLFTWHYIYPQFQKFQGSFELTDAEMQPGAVLGSDVFRNSVSISSLDGVALTAHIRPIWVFCGKRNSVEAGNGN